MIVIAAIERLYTMSHHDRQCPWCGGVVMCIWGEVYPCPHCGRLTVDAHAISRAKAKALRAERTSR